MPVDASTLEHARQSVDAALDQALDGDTPDVPAPVQAEPPSETPEPAKLVDVHPPARVEAAPTKVVTDAQAGPPPSSSEQAQFGPNYQDWIKKHGDPEKGAAHYWEITKQNSALAKEREELQRKLEEYESQGPASPAPEPEAHPDLAQFDGELRAIEEASTGILQTAASYRQQSLQYQAAIDATAAKIGSLSRKLASPTLDVEAEARFKADLAAALEERDGLEANKSRFDQAIAGLDSKAGALVARYQTVKGFKEHRETLLRLEQAREAQERATAEARWEAETDREAQDYAEFRNGLAKELAIPERQLQRFKKYIKDVFVAGLTDEPYADPKAAMREIALDFKAMHDEEFKERSAQFSVKKQQRMETEAPTGQKAVSGSPPSRRPSLQEVYESMEL